MSAEYVFQRPSGYYFRFRVPNDIKHLVCKSELRYSLMTGSATLAKSRARTVAGKVQRLIRSIRRRTTSTMVLTAEQINKIIRQLIKEELEADERDRIMDDRSFSIENFKKDIEVYQVKKKVHQTAFIARKKIFRDDYFKAILTKHGITDIDPESFEYKMFCRETNKAHVKIAKEIQKRQKGQYDASFDDHQQQETSPSPSSEPNVDTGKTISKVMQLFFSEGDSTGKWTPKTIKEINASLQVLIDVLGDVPVNTITRSMMSEFKQTIMKLPPNMNRRYRDKTIAEFLEMKPEKTIAAHTLNRVAGGFSPPAPTTPCMRVRTGRLIKSTGS